MSRFLYVHPALQEAGSFVISHIYTLVSINVVLPESFFEKQTQTEDKTFGPASAETEESVLLEAPLANPGPPSARSGPSQQPLPPVPHHPSIRVWGGREAEGPDGP